MLPPRGKVAQGPARDHGVAQGGGGSRGRRSAGADEAGLGAVPDGTARRGAARAGARGRSLRRTSCTRPLGRPLPRGWRSSPRLSQQCSVAREVQVASGARCTSPTIVWGWWGASKPNHRSGSLNLCCPAKRHRTAGMPMHGKSVAAHPSAFYRRRSAFPSVERPLPESEAANTGWCRQPRSGRRSRR